MDSETASQIPAIRGIEEDDAAVSSSQAPPHINAPAPTCCGTGSSCRSSLGCEPKSSTDATIADPPKQENEPTELGRVFADALKFSISELRKEDEAKMDQMTVAFQEALSVLREGEEKRVIRLEKALAGMKPTPINIDPTTNFWTVYKKVADEHDNDLLKKYAGDLDTSLLFAGLFSAVATAFIVQIIPTLQPNPADLSNTLLLRILEKNDTFDKPNKLEPIMSVPVSVVRAQSILIASLSVTLFVAFIAVLGKQWILYYTRGSTWGSIVDRGKERQVKFVGLKKWGLRFIMESLPVLLQFALLLFSVGLIVYLWDIDLSAAEAITVVTCIGFGFYVCIAAAATIWSDCPFQTPLSVMFPKVWSWAKESLVLRRVWLRRCSTALLSQIDRLEGSNHFISPVGRWCKTAFGWKIAQNQVVGDVYDKHYSMNLPNPVFWRRNPLFTSSPPVDTAASAGFWLLENSTDFSAATAVAAVFSEIQWPSNHHSATALIRLRDTYTECFRAPKFDRSCRLKALQSAAAYYVLYHAWLIRSASKTLEVEVEMPPSDLPPDLLLHKHSDIWGGDDLYEHLLHVGDRSHSVTSAQFLSYIAPYWFCGDSDAGVRFRPTRLQTFNELVAVLERHHAVDQSTLTNCVLCVGAAMDFPLHPDDLIRVNKSDYFAPTFKKVVEHIHGIILAGSRRHRHAAQALEILLTLVNNRQAILPFMDALWINGLLHRAAEGNMNDEKFIQFLRLSARRMEEDATTDDGVEDYVLIERVETDPQSLRTTTTSQIPTPDHTLFSKIMKNIQACVKDEAGWQDEAVYGGLIAIRDIRRLESSLFDDGVLQTLHDAMENDKPFRIRKAAYDAILVTRDQWLRSEELRQKLEDIGFFRQLYRVVVDIARSDYQRSFLMMVEMLSEDEYWHSYLRENMEVWLPLRHEGPEHAIRILINAGQLLQTQWNTHNPTSLDEILQKLVEDEWAGVPGRPVEFLTADRLTPLVEVTEKFKELHCDDDYLAAVSARVRGVIPGLEQRRDDGYEGPGQDIRDIISDLSAKLRAPTRRRTTLWYSS